LYPTSCGGDEGEVESGVKELTFLSYPLISKWSPNQQHARKKLCKGFFSALQKTERFEQVLCPFYVVATKRTKVETGMKELPFLSHLSLGLSLKLAACSREAVKVP
jgi:hypothetical protein